MKMIELLENAKKDINTLIQLNAEEMDKLNSIEFSYFINDDDKCAEFVELVSSDFELLEKKENKFKILQRKDRASHSVITWLLGVGINNNLEIFGNGYHNCNLLWIQTSVNHDYGYYLDEIKDKRIKLEDIAQKYDLLADDYSNIEFDDLNQYLKNIRLSGYGNFFTYNPDIIKNYYDYKKEWSIKHKEKEEINDHGIVGACKLFRLYCEDAKSIVKKGGPLPSITQMEIKKISCYNIASHNIFKSSSKKDDIAYKKHKLDTLTSTSPASIKKDNGLLMLLSLVDTIECYKRFSRKDKMGLNSKTILEHTEINFSDKKLEISYKPLDDYIQKTNREIEIIEKMRDILKKHINGIVDLQKWTEFKTIKIDDFSVQISL